MALVEKISLFFQQGSSDKYYNIAIEEVDEGFMVPFTYGRRGTSGQSGSKTSEPVPYEKAKKAFDKVVKQKRAKGYQVLLVLCHTQRRNLPTLRLLYMQESRLRRLIQVSSRNFSAPLKTMKLNYS